MVRLFCFLTLMAIIGPMAPLNLITSQAFGEVQKTPGVTQTTIRLGQSASFTGASQGLGAQLYKGAKAYFDHINSKGGIYGRKIEIVPLDDGYDPERTLENTKQLVLNENIFALFGYTGTPTLVRALPLIKKFHSDNEVFLFSNFTGAQPQREPPNDHFVFNVRASYAQETELLVEFLLAQGHKRIGMFVQGDAYGRSGQDGVKKALSKRGLKIVGEATYKRGTTLSDSMTSQVEVLKNAKVDAVISIASYLAGAGFIRDARNLGLMFPIANVSFVGPSAMLAILEDLKKTGVIKNLGDDIYCSLVVPSLDDKSISAVLEFKELMERYHPEPPFKLDNLYKDLSFTYISFEGYLNARAFVEVLKRVPKEKLTRTSFFQAAETGGPIELGIGKEKGLFTNNRHQALDSVFLVRANQGNWQEVRVWNKK